MGLSYLKPLLSAFEQHPFIDWPEGSCCTAVQSFVSSAAAAWNHWQADLQLQGLIPVRDPHNVVKRQIQLEFVTAFLLSSQPAVLPPVCFFLLFFCELFFINVCMHLWYVTITWCFFCLGFLCRRYLKISGGLTWLKKLLENNTCAASVAAPKKMLAPC